MDLHDTNYKENATCPHCGYENTDSFEYSLERDEQSVVTFCGSCEGDMEVTLHIEYRYSTKPTQ
jgi:transcription elongation factor Elf1